MGLAVGRKLLTQRSNFEIDGTYDVVPHMKALDEYFPNQLKFWRDVI
jgi:hypothetical protein